MNAATSMTIDDALRQGELPRLERQMLLLHALGRSTTDRAWLLTHGSDRLEEAAQLRFHASCQRRTSGEPVAYITGFKEFFGLNLAVDARVLDPRDDTETLVDWALACVANKAAPHLLDLGTGSGAVALALAHARPDATVHAVDASNDALSVAQHNGARLGLPVCWGLGSWFDNDLPLVPGYDLIASNPPYIAETDPHLAALTHEPMQALASGADGLTDIRAIVQAAPGHLKAGGWLVLEHGYQQAAGVRALLAAAGFTHIATRQDLAGLDRCSAGQRP